MKSRRRISIALLIAASVFLCLLASCGIPTYIVPTVTFKKGTTTSASTTFTVTYKGDAVGDYGKVGLIIMYYPDKAVVDSSDSSKIVSKFSSNYKVSTYDGVVIDVRKNEPVFDITTTQTESGTGSVYAFELDEKAVESPTYTLSMSTSGDFSSSIKLELIDDEGVGKIKMYVDGEEQGTYLTIDDDINLSITSYLNIYAALSVQSSQYSNIFWSSLSSVGAIKTN
ncbi:MAG: hypothetical protein J5800_07580 [Spirochaetales bacterium]|nr:hypothetical protein [Spirochaetales bacterium]